MTTKGSFSKQEQIDSHSSMLTNRLIVEQASTKVWACEILAWEDPFVIEPALRYWCAVQALYTQCAFFFSVDVLKPFRKELEQRLHKGMRLLIKIRMGNSAASAELIWEAWQLHVLIREAGQVLGFWTRMSRVKAKGMIEHIQMFDRINPIEAEKREAVERAKLEKKAKAKA